MAIEDYKVENDFFTYDDSEGYPEFPCCSCIYRFGQHEGVYPCSRCGHNPGEE